MSESIQNSTTGIAAAPEVGVGGDVEAVRWRFVRRAAELYDRPLDVAPADLAGRTDAAALLLAFPWMHDGELLEALWALGEFQAGGDF